MIHKNIYDDDIECFVLTPHLLIIPAINQQYDPPLPQKGGGGGLEGGSRGKQQTRPFSPKLTTKVHR